MSSPRVVLIEDHAMIGQLLGSLIRDELGLNLVATASTVKAAGGLLRREKPDLALVDWRLPDGRGFDLVRELAGDLPKTRWLFMSATEQGHVVREAVSLGVQGFVQKRADLGTMRTAITKVLAGENYYCPDSSRLLVEKMVDESRYARITLTPRESEVLRLFAKGLNAKVIAGQLGISTKTTQNHLTQLKEKLGLYEPAELVHYAIRHGYIEAP